jgi:hypothetical protein
VLDHAEIPCEMHDPAPDIFGHANRRIFAQTVRARVAHRPPFVDEVSSRRAKSQPARIPCSHWNYSLSCTFGESGVSIRKIFSCKLLCAFRASILSISKSKTDSKSAASVNHAHATQNRTNSTGWSRGFNADCKNVDPENKSASAIMSIANIVLRRVL